MITVFVHQTMFYRVDTPLAYKNFNKSKYKNAVCNSIVFGHDWPQEPNLFLSGMFTIILRQVNHSLGSLSE